MQVKLQEQLSPADAEVINVPVKPFISPKQGLDLNRNFFRLNGG